ncbi:C4-dicarboxylate transporter DcuA [Klebsiella michiganensis]|uniref:C4-dicarboxylate transporter DcuA n=1 Tax=Klebsiella michiganensis TaxID=1134687 RepID=A0A7H4PD74_9ENTR|nr:C4-dicarboxylate transporter DcuA [Klebsiella michiganensis]
MFGAELVIVLLAIYLGARLGGIGIGFAGGLGVLVLTLVFQIKPGAIPFDVIEIIMAVIAAIAAMQVAGGMDYLVSLAERMLRRHPKYITFLAPLVTWFMTVLAGTGQYSVLNLTGYHRSGKRTGHPPLTPALHCGGRFADCHYRLADFRSGGLLCRYSRAPGRQLPDATGDLYSGYPDCRHAYRHRL